MLLELTLPLTDEWIQHAVAYTGAVTHKDRIEAAAPFIKQGHDPSLGSAQILAKAYVREVHRRQESIAEAQASLSTLEMDFEELAQRVNPVPAAVRLFVLLVIVSAFAILGYALGRSHS